MTAKPKSLGVIQQTDDSLTFQDMSNPDRYMTSDMWASLEDAR